MSNCTPRAERLAFQDQPSCKLADVLRRPAAAPAGADAVPVQQASDRLPAPGPVRHLGQRCLQALVRLQPQPGHGAAVSRWFAGDDPGSSARAGAVETDAL